MLQDNLPEWLKYLPDGPYKRIFRSYAVFDIVYTNRNRVIYFFKGCTLSVHVATHSNFSSLTALVGS